MCNYYCFSSGKGRKGDLPAISQQVSEIRLFPDAAVPAAAHLALGGHSPDHHVVTRTKIKIK